MKNNQEKISTPSERIKEALALRNMKQVDLSEKSRINKPSISCYISGKYEPKQTALYELGKALDVAEMWLAGYDVHMERPKEQKNNDIMADIVVRMRSDEKFFCAVKTLHGLKGDNFNSALQVLNALVRRAPVD